MNAFMHYFPASKINLFYLTWGFHDGVKHTSAFVISFLLHTCLYSQTGRGAALGGLSLTLDIREGCLCVPGQEACALSLGDAWGSGGHGCSTLGLQVHRGVVQPGRAVDPARGPGGPHMSGHGYRWPLMGFSTDWPWMKLRDSGKLWGRIGGDQ